jgi:hypothetical protein
LVSLVITCDLKGGGALTTEHIQELIRAREEREREKYAKQVARTRKRDGQMH